MTIEESVKANPEKFQKTLDGTAPELQEALNNLSSKLDVIFGKAIKEYCEAEGVDSKLEDIPSYKIVNRMITGKIDEVVKEHIQGKRKDIE